MPIDSGFAVLTVLVLTAAAGYVWDDRRICTYVPGIVIMMALPAVLVNVGVLPLASSVYDAVFAYALPYSISLLLLGVDLRRVWRLCRPLAGIFAVMCVIAVVSVYVSRLFFDLGPDEPEIVPMMAGSYVGGVTNLLGVAEAIGLDRGVTATLMAVDNATASLYVLLVAPLAAWSGLHRHFPHSDPARYVESNAEESKLRMRGGTAVIAIALAGILTWAGLEAASALGIANYGLLLVAVLTVVAVTLLPVTVSEFDRTGLELGWWLMCLFLAALGSSLHVQAIIDHALSFLGFCVVALCFQLLVSVVAAWVLRKPLSEVLVNTVTISIGWPIGAAFARSFRWPWLAMPTLLLGAFAESAASLLGLGLPRF
jgi:uncharacterized membrane protein